jgi:hypothetical protein
METVAKILGGEAGVGPIYWYPRSIENARRGWERVQFFPERASPWVGMFAKGCPSTGIKTGVFCLAGSDVCYIISAGSGYALKVETPEDYTDISLFPITNSQLTPEGEIIILSDFTKIAAYSADGLLWTTPDISWDGIIVNKLTSNEVDASVWNAVTDQWVPISIAIKTGEISGGIGGIPR